MDGVSVIIKKGGKYLMLQQARTRPFPLKWMPVSGAIEEGETPEEAAVREAKEETGLLIKVTGKSAVLKGDYKVRQLHFFTAAWKSGEVRPNPKEVEDYGWFTQEEILKLDMMRATREFLRKHFRKF
jgi:8-oxo-dGTP pyrophosphatase MutT (NUDIX family)